MSQYLIYADQKVTGPFTLQELRVMWRDGGIATDTLCSQNGGLWIPFGNLDADGEMAAQKRILPAFLLLLFLGFLGAHAFYAGRTRQGLYYLVTSVVAGLGKLGLLAFLPFSVFFVAMAAFFGNFFLLFGDFVHIIGKDFKDGRGNKITEW